MTLKLKPDLYYLGVLDHALRTFDIIMRTEFGTTYNAYLLRSGNEVCLFETVKARFADEYFQNLQSLCDPSSIQYLIVSHTEPDHAGSIQRLLEMNPGITIVGTVAAIGFLKEIVNRDFMSRTVRDNDTLRVGEKTLRFFALPNLHWPDTMFTYIEEDRALITCDAFGAHFAHPGILRSTVRDVPDYLASAKYYFDNILGPFKQPFVQKALDRVSDLPLDLVLTGHGPVLDSHLSELFDLYRTWCAKPPKQKKRVVIPYVSAYGFTRALAEAVARGVESDGTVDARLYDLVETDKHIVLADMADAEGLLFGTPTILGDALSPVLELTLHMVGQVYSGKPASAFGSYGWSGEGVPNLLARLRQVKLKVQDEGFRVRFKPTETDLVAAAEFGAAFAQKL